jgi:hypothetical protein
VSKEKHYFPKQINLEGEPLNIAEHLGMVRFFKCHNGKLILLDESENYMLNIIDINEKTSERFGVRGRGQGELIAPISIFSVSDTGMLIYDGMRKEILQVETDNDKKRSLKKVIGLSGAGISTFQVEQINDSLFFGTGTYKDGRFLLFNDRQMIETGNYPIALPQDIPYYVHATGWLSLITKNSKNPLVAVATCYGGLLQIFRVNELDMSVTETAKHELFLPHYTVANIQGAPNFDIDNETRWGYIYIGSDSEHIYGLYSGKIQREDDSFDTGNTIHVFSWDGTPEYEIKTDDELHTIAIDSDKNCLYGLFNTEDGGYDIIRYELNNLQE